MTKTATKTNNSPKLTVTQKQILNLCVEGFSNKGIAKKLDIEPSTVKFHFTRLYNKFDIIQNDTEYSPRVLLVSKWLKYNINVNT